MINTDMTYHRQYRIGQNASRMQLLSHLAMWSLGYDYDRVRLSRILKLVNLASILTVAVAV